MWDRAHSNPRGSGPPGRAPPWAPGTQGCTRPPQGVQLPPGEPACGLGSLWGTCWPAPAPEDASPPRGQCAMGFLDPIQGPFNYPGQMAMLLMEQIESGSPGESGSGGRAAALPVQERDSPPSPTSPQALGSPPARGRRGWDSRVWGLSTEVQRAPTLTCPPLARRASCGCSVVKEHQPAPDRGEEKDGTLGALASLGTWQVAGQGQKPVSRVPPKRPRTPGATGQTQDQGKVSEALPPSADPKGAGQRPQSR